MKQQVPSRRFLGLGVLSMAFLLAGAASLSLGARDVALTEVVAALLNPESGTDASHIVWFLRLPRTLLGIVCGVALGFSGALIQAITRNPLADAGILGVNAGAGFAVTLGVAIGGFSGISQYIWLSFLGAALATVAVYSIGIAARNTSPVTLVLAGIALSAVLGGVSRFITLMSPRTFDHLRSWGVGSIARTELSELLTVIPFILGGIALALLLAVPLNSVALGDELATSLGISVRRTRVLGILAMTLLAGSETALTGGVPFIGLMVPHIVRWFTGPDQRWIMGYSMIAAPTLLLTADVVGRLIARPGEIEAGIVTAIIGAPVLIALARSRKMSSL